MMILFVGGPPHDDSVRVGAPHVMILFVGGPPHDDSVRVGAPHVMILFVEGPPRDDSFRLRDALARSSKPGPGLPVQNV